MAHSANKQLFEYCKQGKTQLLLDALVAIDDFEILDERNNSLLATALKNGHWHTASSLIDKGYVCAIESSTLIAACQYRGDNHQGIIIALDFCTDINVRNSQNRTALMTACLLGHYKKVQELLKNQAHCDLFDVQGNTALIDAVRAKNIKIIKLILSQTINIDHVNNDGDTALHVAIKQRVPLENIIVLLLDAGSDPEFLDSNKQSVWLLAKQKHTKLSRLIERHLNSINQMELPFFTNDYVPAKHTEKHDMVTTHELENATEPVLELSKKSSATVDSIVPDVEYGDDRIEPKISNETQESATTVLDKNITKTSTVFNFQAKKKKVANSQEWFHAAKNGNLGSLNRMIVSGVDINCIDDKGCSALIRACGHSRRAVVSFLLQQNADIELRSKNGSTALSSSVIGNCRRVAGLLLERGANPNGLGPSDYSYATIAAAQWNDAMLSILYRNKAEIFSRNEYQQNLIHIIALGAEYNHNINAAKASIQFLFDHGVDLNVQDINGNTPLMLFCGAHTGNYKTEDRDIASVVHYLIKNGAAPAMTNTAGESAIDAARLHKLQQTKGVLMNALSWND
ncbi:MAG: ankyrin repeat domain-containing protein [Proteobacteria bacterium]|nr:ankyrin repeat domain-containing protein [Pseudomonadota bacterium]